MSGINIILIIVLIECEVDYVPFNKGVLIMSKPIGQTIWNGFSHLPPLSSTEFAVEDVITAFSGYFGRQEQADWDDEETINIKIDTLYRTKNKLMQGTR